MSDTNDVDALFEDDPGSLDEVVDEDDAEDLKLDDLETKVWLVKVKIPSYNVVEQINLFSFVAYLT
jgi:hypothetical protein